MSSTRLPRIEKRSRFSISLTSPAPSVLSPSTAAALELEGVDRSRLLRALGALGGQLEGLQLEGHRYVQAPAAGGAKLGHGRGEAIARGENGRVAEVLGELARKLGVNARRLALRDRVADHGVEIGHRPSRAQAFGLLSAKSLRPAMARA